MHRPEAQRGEAKRGKPKQSYQSTLITIRDVWTKNKRGTANPDAGQELMDKRGNEGYLSVIICNNRSVMMDRSSDLVPA